MVTESDVPLVDESVIRSSPSKKSKAKVPRGIRKAKREKLKRDNMNALFLELGKTLEPAGQNKGKSSTLNDTIRLLRDLLDQVDSLKRENSTLLSEYQYITVEKNELKDDNSGLNEQIEKLQCSIQEAHCQTSPAVAPVYVVPVKSGLNCAEVKRPHARYASSLDSWPSQILSE